MSGAEYRPPVPWTVVQGKGGAVVVTWAAPVLLVGGRES